MIINCLVLEKFDQEGVIWNIRAMRPVGWMILGDKEYTSWVQGLLMLSYILWVWGFKSFWKYHRLEKPLTPFVRVPPFEIPSFHTTPRCAGLQHLPTSSSQ